jgi:hypothetical protein
MDAAGLPRTAEQLAEMALGGEERIARAIASGDAGAVLETYDGIEGAWRGFATILDEWVALTLEHLFLRDGHRPPEEGGRLEQVLVLATRRGIGQERLLLIEEMLSGTENEIRLGLIGALDADDLAAVRLIWSEADVAMRDAITLRCDRVNDVLGQVHGLHGDEGLTAALLHAADNGFWSQALPAQAEHDPAEQAAELAFFLTAAAGCRVRVREEEDRFTIEKIDCHCGRMVRDHRERGWDLHVVAGPSPLTYGLAEMTPYQTHFAVIHGIWAIDRIGQPVPAFECRGLAGGEETCLVQVFKDPAAVPAEVYATLGRPDRPGGPPASG